MEEKKEPEWDKWLCRCSAISKMMASSKENPPLTDKQVIELAELEARETRTEKMNLRVAELVEKRTRSADVVLSDTCIGYLVEAYAWETERMFSVTKEMDVEYFERGKKTEPESIKLLSEVDKEQYLKNDERFYNDFLSGIPDVLTITEEFTAKAIRDIKSTKDYPTFLYKIHKGVDPGNAEQLQGYGDILECGDLGVAFTLPTMPKEQREGYAYKLAMKMGCATQESPEFKKAWAELERSMVFDHMPASKRVYKIPVAPFTLSEKEAVYERVKHCREWLFRFDNTYKKLNR